MNDFEREIVKKFVIKDKQERLLWELENTQKREQIMLRRFPGSQLFKERCLQEIGYLSVDALEKKLLQLGAAKKAYFMGESCMGELTLRQALERADAGEICIVYGGNGVGYYHGEECDGAPPRYLLLEKK